MIRHVATVAASSDISVTLLEISAVKLRTRCAAVRDATHLQVQLLAVMLVPIVILMRVQIDVLLLLLLAPVEMMMMIMIDFHVLPLTSLTKLLLMNIMMRIMRMMHLLLL